MHTAADCAGFDPSAFPHIRTLRCPLSVHPDGSPCTLYSLSPKTLVHRVDLDATRLVTEVPPTFRAETHVLEFPTSIPYPVMGWGMEYLYWLPQNLWVAPHVVVVAPIRADIIVGAVVRQAILRALGGGSSFLPAGQSPSSVTVVGGFENTLDGFGVVPLSYSLRLTRADIRKELRRWARGRTPFKAIVEAHVDECFGRIAFRTLEDAVKSGELDHVYWRTQLECIVLREVVGVPIQFIAPPLR
jgi:hypothetical protein